MALMSAQSEGRGADDAATRGGSWRLPAGVDSVPRARHLTAQRLDELGVSDAGVRGTAELLVSELVSNVIRHTESRPTLRVSRIDHLVRIEVADDEPSGVPLEQHVDVESEHGRGLLLVSALANAWGYDRDDQGKLIWVELDLRSESVLGADSTDSSDQPS
jgi:anti-sigma regulatory factor (Ser/Thr protein kinase)